VLADEIRQQRHPHPEEEEVGELANGDGEDDKAGCQRHAALALGAGRAGSVIASVVDVDLEWKKMGLNLNYWGSI